MSEDPPSGSDETTEPADTEPGSVGERGGHALDRLAELIAQRTTPQDGESGDTDEAATHDEQHEDDHQPAAGDDLG